MNEDILYSDIRYECRSWCVWFNF